MERTPPPAAKELIMYGSDTNIHSMKDKQISLVDWVNPRKKRVYDESDCESSVSQVPAVQKTSCCSENVLSSVKDTIDSFREEMKVMMQTLIDIKNQQESRLTIFQKDIVEIKTSVTHLQKANEEVDQSIDYLGKKYMELEDMNKDCLTTIKLQENKIKDLIQKNTYFEKCNKALEERVCTMEQKDLDCNIELINVQSQEGISTMQIAKTIAKKLNLQSEKIDKAWRVGKIKNGKDSRPIILTLQSREDRKEWLSCRKNPITNGIIFNNNDNNRIYINENVTYQLRRLFWEVKSELKDTYKYIWIQNARILIRKDDTDKKIHQIRFQSDIKSFQTNQAQE